MYNKGQCCVNLDYCPHRPVHLPHSTVNDKDRKGTCMLKNRYHRMLRASAGILCAFTLTIPANPVYAAPDSSELEQKTSELQDDIDTMNNEQIGRASCRERVLLIV